MEPLYITRLPTENPDGPDFYWEFTVLGKNGTPVSDGVIETGLAFPITAPEGFDISSAHWVFNDSLTFIPTGFDYYKKAGIYVQINPNPSWEELKIDFVVEAGGALWIENLHIATDCVAPVPEPATMLLLGSGLLGLVGLRRGVKR